MPDEFQDGNEEAYELFDDAWYSAIYRLRGIVDHAEDSASIEAARILLEYSKSFTVLGAPYVPRADRPFDCPLKPED